MYAMKTNSLIVLSLSVILISGCQTTNQNTQVSLAEAKRLSANFQSQSLEAPPKSISDITAILNEVSSNYAQKFKADENKANRKLEKFFICDDRSIIPRHEYKTPSEINPCEEIQTNAQLYDFYFERGQAAGRLGRIDQQLNDFNQAINFGTNSFRNVSTAYSARGQARILGGNYSKGLADFVAAWDYIAVKSWGSSLFFARQVLKVAELSANSGHLENATKYHTKGMWWFTHQALKSSSKAVNEIVPGSWFDSYSAHIKALIADQQGRLVEGERLHRESINFYKNYYDWSNDERAVSWTEIEAALQDYRLALSKNLRKQGRLKEAEAEARLALNGAL